MNKEAQQTLPKTCFTALYLMSLKGYISVTVGLSLMLGISTNAQGANAQDASHHKISASMQAFDGLPQLRYLTSDRHHGHSRHSRHSRHSGSSVRWGVGVGWNNGWRYPYYNRWGNRWNNGWGYGWNNGIGWNNGWQTPYRYDYYDRHYRRNYVQPQQHQVVSPPKRSTTSIEYASGLTQLPENARAIQRDGRTIYQWQGQEYYFDWSSQRYMRLAAEKD
ncbi:hypothetical protein [Shewanella sp. 10N.286.52.B9]|uniref:hypothetical protein n=1 Tax=Shewanella sp. 10N.286.52.B9 TaxID=1880837 RepID=UPI000C85AB64|nr:hypothetical protein [Shewanella sp. 10N.286.52.B9]PMG48403.1 hypothetical protein BCU91_19030 [Shewanella sp. 10N.286.52.B9]